MDKQKTQKVVVVGQGYVGLPVAVRAAEVGYQVVGLDLDANKVATLRAGKSYVEDIDSTVIARLLGVGTYYPSTNFANAAQFDVAVISVPTPLRESMPDLSFIESAAKSLAPYVTKGATVILESTTYPGTTEDLLIPILEAGSGLKAREDFHVGYSPERIDPGNIEYGFVQTPKVVSGVDEESLSKVSEFFGNLVDTIVPVSGTKEAELTKLLENTFRHVNIALVNELAMYAHELGIDIWEVVAAAETKPFGFMKFSPGPGVGGHCLPVDPSYLSWQVMRTLGQRFRFVELANDINAQMPHYVLARLGSALNAQGKALKDSRVMVIGLAYKAGTGDTREAPASRVIDLLQHAGVDVCAVDPYVRESRWPRGVEKVDLTAEEVKKMDAVVLITAHHELDYDVLENVGAIVLDTRGVLKGAAVDRL